MSVARQIVSVLGSSTLVHVAFAFVAMGGWAMFANAGHPLGEAVQAGVVQGTISALITLGMKKGLEWLSARFSGIAALLAPPVITASAILAILFGVHTLAGTPEIVRTIAVPFAVSSTYAIIYNFGLWKRHGR